MFVFFGSNAFFHFMPMPEMSGPSGAFIGAMASTGYLQAVAGLQVLGGLLLLIGLVPLGLLILGPIIVNIVLFHVFLERNGLGMSIGIAALALFLLWSCWNAFAAIFRK